MIKPCSDGSTTLKQISGIMIPKVLKSLESYWGINIKRTVGYGLSLFLKHPIAAFLFFDAGFV